MQIPKTIQNKLDEGRQYRRFDVAGLELRAEGNEERVVEGYATTFNQPYLLYREGSYEVWEQVDARAFDDCDMSDEIGRAHV